MRALMHSWVKQYTKVNLKEKLFVRHFKQCDNERHHKMIRIFFWKNWNEKIEDKKYEEKSQRYDNHRALHCFAGCDDLVAGLGGRA